MFFCFSQVHHYFEGKRILELGEKQRKLSGLFHFLRFLWLSLGWWDFFITKTVAKNSFLHLKLNQGKYFPWKGVPCIQSQLSIWNFVCGKSLRGYNFDDYVIYPEKQASKRVNECPRNSSVLYIQVFSSRPDCWESPEESLLAFFFEKYS